ncbi:MAG: glycosyltransferase [Clostridia bacterium]|nr:glycosyltransferase [Clostridia bacterium]
MSKISIIVPVFNAEKFIDNCVKSIVNQTLQDLEIILINDGSLDNSGELCDNWAEIDGRIIVHHQKNSGQCTARNFGLNIATGKYIMFVDSDDFLNNTICEKLYCIAEENSADLVRCNFKTITNHNDLIETSKEDSKEITFYSTENALKNFVCAPYSSKKHFPAIVWAAIYKSELFDNIRFPDGLIYEEGFVLPPIFLKCRKLAHLDEQLYYYYSNPVGTMGTGLTDKGLKSLDDWKEIHELISPIYPSLKTATALRWIKKYINTYHQIIKNKDIDQNDYYKHYIIDTLFQNLSYFESFIKKRDLKELYYFLKIKNYNFQKIIIFIKNIYHRIF